MNSKKSIVSNGKTIAWANGLTACIAAMAMQTSIAAEWPTEQIGLGAVSLERVGTQLFNWAQGNRADRAPPANPYVTADFSGPIPSNDWATSLIVDQYSKALHAHPLSFKATPQGFEVAMAPETIGPIDGMGETSVRRNHKGNVDLVVNGNNLTANDARLASTGDWTYNIEMADSDAKMNIVIGHGLPFAYFNFTGSDAVINLARNSSIKDIVLQQDSAALIRILDPVDNEYNYYGIFYPDSATFSQANNQLSVDFTNDSGYLSIAGLPDGSTETWNQFHSVAYNFVTDTQVDWQYDEANGQIITQYNVTTENKPESTRNGTALALLPHQWRNSANSANAASFDSVRGEMKTIIGNGFTTTMAFNGILPRLPLPQTSDSVQTLTKHLTDYYGYGYSLEPAFIQPGSDGGNTGFDTYWMGKNLNRLSGLISVSDALDDTNPDLVEVTDTMVEAMQGQLEFWFNADKDRADNYFYYNQDWGTLIGYPTSYDTDTDLNDHHFHYGYWINAAAQIALRNAQWGENDQWGGMVKELINDIATTDRDSTRYPFLRNYDVYEGHSWASGTVPYVEDGFYPEGNNNEASSEGIHAWAGLILWGEATGDTAIRDLGIYLYTHEVESANTYWFNLYGDVGHSDYPNIEASRVWGGGYDHTTWWTENPIQTHAINMLPITGASLYLGKDPAFVQQNHDAIWTEYTLWDGDGGTFNKEQVRLGWQDIVNKYLAFADPDLAIANWRDTNIDEDPVNGVDPGLGIEFGESRAQTYQHLQMLKQFGQPDFSVRPIGHTLGAVLKKNGVKTYIGYNPTNQAKTLTFSDSMGLINVPAKSFAQGLGEPVVITNEDTDNDGINDGMDQCANTPSGATVNAVGCPDSDSDGVFDNNDLCPGTAAGTNVDATGCEVIVVVGDDDNDGVNNDIDLCSGTAAGAKVDATGCEIIVVVGDDDNDGVNNDIDLCPGTAAGTNVDATGCEVIVVVGDDDNDGVNNDNDLCPGTAASANVDATGCEISTTLWGVTDLENGQATVYLTTTDWADVHYLINNSQQQNVRMLQVNGRNEWTIAGLNDGDSIRFWFTYLDPECACVHDSVQIEIVVEGGTTTNSDTDADGVIDSIDQCPATPIGDSVDSVGCTIQLPQDSDNDGVTDAADTCPNTPAGVAVDTNGCEISTTDTFGATALGDGSVMIFANTNAWADVHYQINNGGQQNVRLLQTGTRNELTVSGLSSSDTLSYFFTYWDNECNCAKDTSTFTFVMP